LGSSSLPWTWSCLCWCLEIWSTAKTSTENDIPQT
jgi:hypothetical protein